MRKKKKKNLQDWGIGREDCTEIYLKENSCEEANRIVPAYNRD
jgi:hypothetical protein